MSRYRILAIALLISLFWHLFWLSAVKVLYDPNAVGRVKFSRVSFLGPILDPGAIEVRVEPKARSFLEKRYLESARRLAGFGDTRAGNPYDKAGIGDSSRISTADQKPHLVDEAVSGTKLEPPYFAE